MAGMMQTALGQVTEIIQKHTGYTEIIVDIHGRLEKAINYDLMTGEVEKGNHVVLNTTAVILGLGTGGYHFVLINLSQAEIQIGGAGHIMKLRYTPQQIKTLSIEEKDSGFTEIFNNFSSLEGLPVIIFSLHSALAPIILSLKSEHPRAKIAYIMTDGGALPLKISQNVSELKESGFLETVITCGHAFGGDLESVNVFSALIAAKEIVQADVVVIGIGPGHVGTGTKWGFSGIQAGEIINAVNILGGRPLFSPRISFRDPRPRHQGISHHSITVLSQVALSPSIVILPYLSADKNLYIQKQIKENSIDRKHTVVWEYGEKGIEMIIENKFRITTMGRQIDEEKDYFLTACAAGIYGGKASMEVGFN
jgi:hypothetical protein